MPALYEAIILVRSICEGQQGGAKKMEDSFRIMLRMKSEESMITAVLQSVWGNFGVTLEFLQERGFGERVIEALEYLGDMPNEEDDGDAFIERMCQGPALAIAVKIAGLMDKAELLIVQSTRRKGGDGVNKYKVLIDALLGELSSVGERIEDWIVSF